MNTLKKLNALFFTFMIAFTMAKAQQETSPTPTAPTSGDTTSAQFPAASTYEHTDLTFKIIDAPNKTFGYDVYADGRLMIHQSSIPGLPGNEGFKTKHDAEKVAMLVIGKIRKGEMPPTVSNEEMKKLKVIK